MEKLWRMVHCHLPEDMTTGVFLTINILCWTFGTLLFGILFCAAVVRTAVTGCLLNIMCVSIYAGIIFGLFGGILFLMRRS